jgi:Tfp pilus assembly protein PilO
MNAKNAFGAITVAIALFFLWPGVFSSWSEMRALKAAVAEREALVIERDAILKTAADEYAKYREILQGSSATTFTSLVPAKKDTAELVSAVGAIATSAGLELTKIQILQATSARAADPYATMTLAIELSGAYTSLRTFLQDLETYIRVLNVTSIEIASDNAGALKFGVRADTYYIK